MATLRQEGHTGPPPDRPTTGMAIEASALTATVRGGTTVLHGIELRIEPGELVAIIGGSGAGKTTLLDALSGVRPAGAGTVAFDGIDFSADPAAFRTALGYVPQDDIVHTELPVSRTLRYSAQLRLPDVGGAELDDLVARVMDALSLTERSDVAVGALSGGQRKRVSIAVELLADPRAFFLDEPTSGLDPATAADLLRRLRMLADAGSTVVFTTHAVQDVAACDRVVVLASGGHLAFSGTVAGALEHFGATEVADIYERLAERDGASWAEHLAEVRTDLPTGEPPRGARPVARPRVGALRQMGVLTRRAGETIVRNRLTLAILLGSPTMVVAMFAVL